MSDYDLFWMNRDCGELLIQLNAHHFVTKKPFEIEDFEKREGKPFYYNSDKNEFGVVEFIDPKDAINFVNKFKPNRENG